MCFRLLYLNSACQLFRQITWDIQNETTCKFYLFRLEGLGIRVGLGFRVALRDRDSIDQRIRTTAEVSPLPASFCLGKNLCWRTLGKDPTAAQQHDAIEALQAPDSQIQGC